MSILTSLGGLQASGGDPHGAGVPGVAHPDEGGAGGRVAQTAPLPPGGQQPAGRHREAGGDCSRLHARRHTHTDTHARSYKLRGAGAHIHRDADAGSHRTLALFLFFFRHAFTNINPLAERTHGGPFSTSLIM